MSSPNEPSNSKPSYPLPLIPLPYNPTDFDSMEFPTRLHIEMIIAHNVIIRGLNSLHHNIPLVSPPSAGSKPNTSKVQAFVQYALAFLSLVHAHHSVEEVVLFPFLRGSALMKEDIDKNEAQHELFHSGTEKFEEYMTAVAGGKVTYDAEKAMSILNSFAGDLVQHLHDEIPTIEPERWIEFSSAEIQGVKKDFEAGIAKEASLFTHLPFALMHHDIRTAPAWPPFPAPMLWIARYVTSLRHSSYWQFSPFTKSGAPRVGMGSSG